MIMENQSVEPMSAKEWMQYFSEHPLSADEIGELFHRIVYEGLLSDEENLPELTEYMLSLGMDPNQQVLDSEFEENGKTLYYFRNFLMELLDYEEGHSGMKAARVLLEHGADPNAIYDTEDGSTPFYYYDDWPYYSDEGMPLDAFYGLILCSAYGGVNADGQPSFEMLNGEPITALKDFEKYSFEYEHLPSLTGKSGEYVLGKMYVTEKATGIRIAKYRW